MGRLDGDAPIDAMRVASPVASVGGSLRRRSYRPWLVTVVVVVGAMAVISGISHLAAKAGSPSIALSDR